MDCITLVHVAGPDVGKDQCCAQCGNYIAHTWELEPISFPEGIEVVTRHYANGSRWTIPKVLSSYSGEDCVGEQR